MFCFIPVIMCFFVLLDIQTLCQERQKCERGVTSCGQINANLSQFYISSSPNITNARSMSRKQNSRVHRKRKHLNRRKNVQRKTHRHSTRVLSLKPAIILLPPFENDIKQRNVSTLNPFIINILANSKDLNENFDFVHPLSDYEQKMPLTSVAPVSEIKKNSKNAQDSNFVSVTEHSKNPAINTPPGISSIIEHNQTSVNLPLSNIEVDRTPLNKVEPINTPPTPYAYLLPPFPEKRNNDFNSQQLENPTNFQFPDVPMDEFTEVRGLVLNHQSYETSSFSTFLPIEENVSKEGINPTVLYDNYSYSTFETTIQPVLDSFNSTTSANDYTHMYQDHKRNSYNSFNNTLLAPEVASLGMKIITSKKGLEMVKELSTNSEPKPSSRNEHYDRSNSNLETAESGDIRLHTYNQILSIEDTKDASKDEYKALKKPHRPFEVCNENQGYVADPSSGCQVFYICLGSGAGEPMMCPNGTLFNQEVLVCDWWYNVECSV